MASDKLMNHTQGETIITKLTAIADSLDDLAAVTPAKLGMGIATCDTAASTAAKTAALANFALVEGAPVSVQFTYANTATNATLNINNTGAKPIIYKDAAIGNDVISAGDTCTFIYTTNTYKITNIDTLTGPGSGTVRQVGAENGLITDQTDNADIQTTGNIGLNLKSTTAFSTEVGAHNTSTDNMYPVALDSEGHPVAAVPNGSTTAKGTVQLTDSVGTSSGASTTDVPTEKAVAEAIESIGKPMVWTGTITLTADSTDTTKCSIAVSKPASANDIKNGYTYRIGSIASSPVYTGPYKVGDTFIASKDKPDVTANWVVGTDWDYTPSGDEPSGTVTGVKMTSAGTTIDPDGNGVVTLTEFVGSGTGHKSGLVPDPGSTAGTKKYLVEDGTWKAPDSTFESTPTDNTIPSSKLVKDSLDTKVVGPSSVTGDTIVLFDSTTGKLVKSSSKTFESLYSISDDDTKIPTSKGIRENAATYGKLGTYSADTSRTNITNTTTIKGAVKQLEYREELNKSNILLVEKSNPMCNELHYNVEDLKKINSSDYSWSYNVASLSGIKFTINEDNSISWVATNIANTVWFILYDSAEMPAIASGEYVLHGCPSGGGISTYELEAVVGGSDKKEYGDSTSFTVSNNLTLVAIGIRAGSSSGTFYPVLINKSLYDAGITDYVAPALPNSDLTNLEAEDRAALAEVVDSGAKQKLNYSLASLQASNPSASGYDWNNNVCTVQNVRFTVNSDLTITVKQLGSHSTSAIFNICDYTAVSGDYVSGGYGTGNAYFYTRGGGVTDTDGKGREVNSQLIGVSKTYAIAVIPENTVTSDIVFKPMVCTKAAFGVSQKFVAYRLPYDDVQSKTTLLMNNMGGLTFQGSDLNTLVAGGRYLVNNATDNPISNAPYNSWQTVEVFQSDYGTYPKVYYQIATDVTGATVTSKWRRRVYNSGGQYNAWTTWSS